MIKGKVLRIEKASIHDGEGLRTVVFLKGCPLRCQWCSTPESQSFAIEQSETYLYGKEMTADEVVREVCKDEIFFFHSGGGVTISGGEVLCQADFAGEILKKCREQGIATAVETSLYAPYQKVRKLSAYLDDFYIDMKLYEEQAHLQYTGVSNALILENLKRLDSEFPGHIHIRIPTIPGINMTEENMRDTALFLVNLRHISDLELLPYHRLGTDTYHRLGREYQLSQTEPPSGEDMKKMAEIIRRYTPDLPIRISGELYN